MREGHKNINLDFSRRGAPSYLTKAVRRGVEEGCSVFKIRPKNGIHGIYPNVCVSIAGILDHFRQAYDCVFVGSNEHNLSQYLLRVGVLDPRGMGVEDAAASALNCVWRFNPETHHSVIDAMMGSFRRADDMGKGVLHGLELALNEVTDNIIQHSRRTTDSEDIHGYVMGQYHRTSGKIAIAVYDTGQGIMASLNAGGHGLKDPRDALTLSLKKGTTDGRGRGNGLWMMSRIVSAAEGRFELSSDGARYSMISGADGEDARIQFSSSHRLKEGTTFVDFQISAKADIDLAEALDAHEPTNLWVDDRLSDSLDEMRVSARSESRGFGSRYEAAAFANYVLNLMKEAPVPCTIDFSGVEVISASYADELIVLLLRHLGFVGFSNRIRLAGVNDLCRAMIDKCMRDRLDEKGQVL